MIQNLKTDIELFFKKTYKLSTKASLYEDEKSNEF